VNQPTRSFEAAKETAQGERQNNQDRCLFLGNGDTNLLGVADGLGGHPRGEVAAQLLVDVCETLFRRAEKPLSNPEHFMLQCIGQAHSAILNFGMRQTPEIAPRTTAVLAVVQAGFVHWVHVGDSRLYLIRNGEILSQTRDHSQIRFVRQSAYELSRPQSSLTRCLGGLPQPPTTTCGPATQLHNQDVVVLCSDGLWQQLPDEDLAQALRNPAQALGTCLSTLVKRAAAAPNSDNVTAVALRWLAAQSALPAQQPEQQVAPESAPEHPTGSQAESGDT